jgi:mono/diheme cytochrome c family protein
MRFVTISTGIFVVAAAAGAASRSVWDGVYSKDQSARGQAAYNSKCARCHGEALLGGEGSPPLVDRDFLEKWNGKPVGTIADLTYKTMPSDGPGKLSRQQVSDILAYVLSANGFPAGPDALPTDLSALNEIILQAKK